MKYFLILFALLNFNFANAQAKQTVYSSLKWAGTIQGNHVSQTTPTLTVTVPSGQWCEVTSSFFGVASSSSSFPVFRIVISSIQALTFGNVPTGNSPYNVAGTSPTIRLPAGSYTIQLVGGSFAASSGHLHYYGSCYYL